MGGGGGNDDDDSESSSSFPAPNEKYEVNDFPPEPYVTTFKCQLRSKSEGPILRNKREMKGDTFGESVRAERGDADWEGESAKRFESFCETLSFRACIAAIDFFLSEETR